MVTIKEGEVLLANTEHAVTYKQLAGQLERNRAQRERHGKTDYYSISDVLVAHRDIVDRSLN
jgi:hypothetical protein